MNASDTAVDSSMPQRSVDRMSSAVVAKNRRTAAKRRGRNGKPAATVTLHDALKAFDARADDLPSDLAAQHDHYLYGTPKRAGR